MKVIVTDLDKREDHEVEVASPEAIDLDTVIPEFMHTKAIVHACVTSDDKILAMYNTQWWGAS